MLISRLLFERDDKFQQTWATAAIAVTATKERVQKYVTNRFKHVKELIVNPINSARSESFMKIYRKVVESLCCSS